MHSAHEELLRIENELGRGDGDTYRRHLAEEAVVVVPGAVLDREGCAAAIDATPAWDECEISDARSIAVGESGAILSYRWRSRRGDVLYTATMSSVYVERDGSWRLVLHQQTPDPAP